MDQSAFRSLLSSSSSTTTPSSSSRPKFGAPPPKPSTSSSSSGKPTDFKPRPPSSKKKEKEFKKKPSTEEGAYRDRAAERRAGKAGDFREAEKLLEEFEERGKQGDEEDRIKREEQRKYLGGDATHSILVKGLDMALLNQEKAKLSMKAEGELEDVEQQLDEQFEKPVSSKKGQGKGKEKEIGKGKGKTRDELLMELKASREGGDQGKNEAGLGKGWKKLGAPEMAVTKGKGFAPVGGGGEKKLRKKKKKVVDPSTPATPTASTSAPPSITSVPPASASTQVKKGDLPTMNPDEDDDDDIFGDVGDYKGLESDSDSSSDEKKPRIKKETSLPAPALPPSHPNSTKRKYFDDEEAQDESISTAPSAVADLASRQALHSATQPQPKRRVKREDSFGSQSGSESDSEAGATMGKLQPLSGSGPNVSELLKFDKLAQEEEERKAKKQKRKQEKEEKELSRADKDNRDYLQMEAYLEKKKNGGVTPERKQSDERDMRDKEGMYADI